MGEQPGGGTAAWNRFGWELGTLELRVVAGLLTVSTGIAHTDGFADEVNRRAEVEAS